MRYVGGKFRIAAHLEPLVNSARIHSRATTYVEPFLGGASTFTLFAPHFRRAIGADVVPDLIAMWQAARDGWTPPTDLDLTEYHALRDAKPSALRGFAGFACSFGGKWFGGFARNHGTGVVKPNGDLYDEVGISARRVIEQARAVPQAEYVVSDYRALDIPPGSLIYADPPYAETTGYGAAGTFDHAEFWQVAEAWARDGHAVLVSEQVAPAPWVEVWSRPLPDYLSGRQEAGARIERLFALPDLAAIYDEGPGLFDLEDGAA